ncbi:hypothetical protein [Flavobacterium sp.]|uniref:hypothetical protein n=1 Tax=Flavobacterium sp. TaxID=239 RepID=UPI0011F9BC55|nr:hypothetical protein [Flavobacterium sp.]RZJ70213.1 MAG: hypothetical protein EOO49_14605 [Flavobacterium sp.]
MICLLFLSCFFATNAQENESEWGKPKEDMRTTRTFSGIPQGRFYYLYPIHFGDQQFAKAYDVSFGYGINLSPLRYKNFRLNLGFERTLYKVVDHSRVAEPVDISTYQSFFTEVSYGLGSEAKFCVKPSVGIGFSNFYLKTGSGRFGSQEAVDFRSGLTADWAVLNHLSLFLTAHYVRSNIDVDTAGEFREYYSKANSVQLGLGIVIR